MLPDGNAGYHLTSVVCAKGQKCCNKLKLDGTYPVAVFIDIQYKDWFGKSCHVTGEVWADVEVAGEIGQCQ